MILGMGLVVGSQCVQAAQITFEDFFMVRVKLTWRRGCVLVLLGTSAAAPCTTASPCASCCPSQADMNIPPLKIVGYEGLFGELWGCFPGGHVRQPINCAGQRLIALMTCPLVQYFSVQGSAIVRHKRLWRHHRRLGVCIVMPVCKTAQVVN